MVGDITYIDIHVSTNLTAGAITYIDFIHISHCILPQMTSHRICSAIATASDINYCKFIDVRGD